MSFFTAFAVYFIIWWLTLFLMLPYGVRSQAEAENVVPGTDPGAPVNAQAAVKLLANTIVAALIFGAWYCVTHVMGYGFGDIPQHCPARPQRLKPVSNLAQKTKGRARGPA